MNLGRFPSSSWNFNGLLDEIRISSSARSVTWIYAEYNNQNDPGTFYSVASQEANDTTAPSISTLSPADNGTDVAIDTNLVITFDENIDIKTGNVTIKKTSDDSTIEAIDVTSGQVTGNGTTSITINPSSDLSGSTEYYVLIDATAFDDESGNSYTGISSTTAWSFTTIDATNPTVSTLSPADNGTDVAVDTNLVITFDENIDIQTGNLNIHYANGDLFEAIDVTSGQVTGNGGTAITINPSTNFDYLTEYYVLIDATAFDDESANSYAGISSTTAWSFTTAEENLGWFLNDWEYRIQLTVNSSEVDDDLTDFPVYVDMGDLPAGFFSAVRSDGGDIRVTTSDQRPVPHEVVVINTNNGTGEIHFKAPTLSSSSDTDFWIYYGNANGRMLNGAHEYGAQNVWSNGYVAVYHMQQDPSPAGALIKDSTSFRNHGTPNGSMTSGDSVSGKLGNGNALDFDGSDDYLSMGDVLDMGSGDSVLTAWVKTSENTDYSGLLGKSYYGSKVGRYGMHIRSSGKAGAMVQKTAGNVELSASTTTINNNAWHLLNTVFDRDSGIYFYTDGSDDGSQVTSFDSENFNTTDPFVIALYNNYGSGYSAAIIDEVRISNKTRSATWISTEYNNQSSPSTFYTVGGSSETNADDSNPKVLRFHPPSAATHFPLRANLTMVFDETVTADSGNIVIYDAADDSTFETISCSGGLVTISSDTVTINPSSNFTAGKTYYVQIPNTCFKDASDNYYSGIENNYLWRFTAQGNRGPHPLFFDSLL